MRKRLIHVSSWLLFFFTWNQIMYFYVSNILNRIYFSALDTSLFIVAFYIIYLYIMPMYFQHKNLGKLLLSSALVIIPLAALDAWVMGILLHHMLVPIRFNFSWNYVDMQYNRLFIALIGAVGGSLALLAIDRLKTEQKIEKIEKEKSQAELIYLKSQLNPHFLFNSLNGLYTQIDLNTEEAKNTLVSIAELLRYQLYECNVPLITLTQELAYLKNYFNLQLIRNDNVIVTFTIEGNTEDLCIAPLLLIPFLENAFKFVSVNECQDNRIAVQLQMHGLKLEFTCMNTIDVLYETNRERHNGIGLINVKKRLKLLYPETYILSQSIKEGAYFVHLELQLVRC